MSDLYKSFRKCFWGYFEMNQMKQTNKQTKKRKNKHFFWIENISAKSCTIFTKTFRKFSVGYPEFIQIKKPKIRQTNKQTNK